MKIVVTLETGRALTGRLIGPAEAAVFEEGSCPRCGQQPLRVKLVLSTRTLRKSSRTAAAACTDCGSYIGAVEVFDQQQEPSGRP